MSHTFLTNGDGTSVLDKTFGKITGLSSVFFKKIETASIIVINTEIVIHIIITLELGQTIAKKK